MPPPHSPLSPALAQAVRVLRAGGLVALPTETVYGLGADAEQVAAVERIFATKDRPTSHPLIVHVARSEAMARWAADVPSAARVLAERFWPGTLTLVLRRGARVPLAVTGGLDTVALRVPAHPLALALLEAFGGGIAAPSANRFGSISPTTAQHVRDDLGDAVDFVLDGGPCAVGVESTIVDVTGEQPAILRPGGVSREAMQAALGHDVPVRADVTVRAPGQHLTHYAPRAQVVLVEATAIPDTARALLAGGRRVGVLLPAEQSASFASDITVLPVPSSLDDYAHALFTLLRAFDQQGCDVIVASVPPAMGIGLAIADRLQRAAGPRTR